MRGGYLLRLADGPGQCALRQAGEKRLALGLGDAVPERRAKSAGPDRVDADGGEFDRQSPDEAFGGSSAGGGERCPGTGRWPTVPVVNPIDPPGLTRGAACLMTVTAPQKRTSRSRAVAEAEVGEWTGVNASPAVNTR